LAVTTATELALAGAEFAAGFDFADVGTCADGFEEGKAGGCAGYGGVGEDLGVDDERDFRDGGDLMATSEEEGWDGGGS
jgi:hypothetical protein